LTNGAVKTVGFLEKRNAIGKPKKKVKKQQVIFWLSKILITLKIRLF